MKEKLMPMIVIFLIALMAEVWAEGPKLDGEVTRPNAICNIFEGSWVQDYSYPLYLPSKCPFIQDKYDCHIHNRPDKFYMHYRWQPSACNIPKFNAEHFLRKFEGKKIMFVGDSLSVNMWQSLTCMIHSALPQAQYTETRQQTQHGNVFNFRFPAHDVSILVATDLFIVDVVEDDPNRQGVVLKLNSISHGNMWKNHDVLIFNPFNFWLHDTSKPLWGNVHIGNLTFKEVDRLLVFKKVLMTWANWVDSNIDPSKTKVFYQGISPVHLDGIEWGDPSAKSCVGETKPIQGSRYFGGPHPAEKVVKKVLKSMNTPVYLLDFTRLSQLRKDGHTIHNSIDGHITVDCIDWCLPGVPDTWNELLSVALLQNGD